MNDKKFYVYSIRSKTSGKAYYGSTNNFKRRRSQHLVLLRRGAHHSPHLQRAWDLYQQDDFVIEILHVFNNETDMLVCEKELIKDIRSTYNTSTEVDKCHMRGRKHSDETKEKLSKMFSGRAVSEETKILIRAARKNQIVRSGFKHSEDTKSKIRIARAKQISSNLGLKMTESAKQKMKFAKLGKEFPRVKVITPDGIFVGVKDAAKHFGVHVATIRYRVKVQTDGWSYASL